MTDTRASSAPAAAVGTPAEVRVVVTLLGALAVALAAQVSLPLPGTPVPFTLQPLAVLMVGGLLGPRLGAVALVAYLVMGAAGLPVFTPGGLPGVTRLLGPTGGYLLAYPFAAALVGGLVRGAPHARVTGTLDQRPSFVACGIAALLGAAAIHAGGAAQLAILTGSARVAFAVGVGPFLLPDLVKVLLAAVVIRRLLPYTRVLA